MNKKKIRTTITLADGMFNTGNQIVIEDLRTLATIHFGGGAILPHAEVIIYGLAMDKMLRLMRVRWQDVTSLQNTIKVEAGEEGKMLVVYEGNISFAYVDTSNAPNISMRITSSTAALEIYTPTSPITFSGEVAVSDAIETLCNRIGYSFENSGVPSSVVMRDVTLDDTDLNKIRTLCRDYDIDLYVEAQRVSIAARGKPRQLKVPLISPSSGLIGYPQPTMQGVEFRCLLNPLVRFGGLLRLEDSVITPCNGDWRVFGVTLNLESEIPNGSWHMSVKAAHAGDNNVAINR